MSTGTQLVLLDLTVLTRQVSYWYHKPHLRILAVPGRPRLQRFFFRNNHSESEQQARSEYRRTNRSSDTSVSHASGVSICLPSSLFKVSDSSCLLFNLLDKIARNVFSLGDFPWLASHSWPPSLSPRAAAAADLVV